MSLVDDVKARYKLLSFQTILLSEITTDIAKGIYKYIAEHALFDDEMCAYFCVAKNNKYILYYDIGRSFFDTASVCHIDLSRDECVSARNNALLLLQKYIGTDLMLTKDDASCIKILYPIIEDRFEKFDGSGFPVGKRGDRISLAGRVVSVSEFVAKAIINCVRKDVLLKQLEELSGKDFDPALVDITKQLVEDIYRELFETLELSDDEKYIQLEYEEIRDTVSDSVDSCVVEMQLIDDKYNVISRAAYTAVAEKTNRIFALTKLMFEEVCENMAMLRFSDSDIVKKFVLPLSVGCLNKKLFLQYVKRMINKYKINPENFIFAVTETVLGYGDPTVIDSLREFKRAGIKIAIDNFGSEFSSLSRLDSFDFDILKIDRQFIEQIHLSKKAYELVKGMISIAESLELVMIADGVDSEAQKDMLTELGCKYMQGAYFGGKNLLKIDLISEGKTN